VYSGRVIHVVVLSKKAEKDLATVPTHVALKLQDWVEDVEERGIEAVRKVPGYHDEPLKGALKGQRSIRLSKAYRAYYRVMRDAVEFLRVEGVDKHVY
jgi:toxin HigB-1